MSLELSNSTYIKPAPLTAPSENGRQAISEPGLELVPIFDPVTRMFVEFPADSLVVPVEDRVEDEKPMELSFPKPHRLILHNIPPNSNSIALVNGEFKFSKGYGDAHHIIHQQDFYNDGMNICFNNFTNYSQNFSKFLHEYYSIIVETKNPAVGELKHHITNGLVVPKWYHAQIHNGKCTTDPELRKIMAFAVTATNLVLQHENNYKDLYNNRKICSMFKKLFDRNEDRNELYRQSLGILDSLDKYYPGVVEKYLELINDR